MKLKLTEDGKFAEVVDGKPVYIGDDGKEIAFDAVSTISTISRLNGEAKGHRERAEANAAALKAFEGLEPEVARKALETVQGLNEKQLIAAGDRDKAVSEAIKATEEKYKPVVKKAERLEEALYSEKVGGAFARSKFITEKLAIPADMVQARFGSSFKIEDGKMVAYDHLGNKIFSRSRAGEVADFDESIEQLVDAYPAKDYILKGTGASGGGANGGSNGAGGGRTMTRAQLEAMPPAQRGEAMKGKTLIDA